MCLVGYVVFIRPKIHLLCIIVLLIYILAVLCLTAGLANSGHMFEHICVCTFNCFIFNLRC